MPIFLRIFIINTRLLIKGSSLRFGYSQSQRLFFVQDNGQRVYFSELRRGFRIYKNGLIRRVELLKAEYHLDSVSLKAGDTVIDCGANSGDLFVALKMSGLDCNYLGIEPAPIEFKALEINTPVGQCVNKALGENSGMQEFFLSTKGADSSLIEPIAYTDKIPVEVTTLDDIIKRPVKLLKLEAEGCELEVLHGASKSLDYIQYISADLGPERGVKRQLTFMPVYNFLISRGFALVEVGYPRLVALFRNTSVSE